MWKILVIIVFVIVGCDGWVAIDKYVKNRTTAKVLAALWSLIMAIIAIVMAAHHYLPIVSILISCYWLIMAIVGHHGIDVCEEK